MACPSETTIDLLLSGRLSPRENDAIQQHLATCSECRVLVSALARGRAETVRADAPPEPAPTPEANTFSVGELVADRYRILRFIARGGMGEVYEAEDRELQIRVALKTVRAEVSTNANILERFKRE